MLKAVPRPAPLDPPSANDMEIMERAAPLLAQDCFRSVKRHMTSTFVVGRLLRVPDAVVRRVDLENNGISYLGVAAIADALMVNRTVTWLSLRNNSFGTDGLQRLAAALAVNDTLACLELNGNTASHGGWTALEEALEVNTSLVYVGLPADASIRAARSRIKALVARNRVAREVAVQQRDFFRSLPGHDAVPWIAPDVLGIVAQYAAPSNACAEADSPAAFVEWLDEDWSPAV